MHSLPSPGESSRSMAYSADGRLLAVGCVSGQAKVWETATGTSELWDPASGRVAAPLAGEGQVTSLAASTDGRLFASTTMSGAASGW
ncbi:MAG: hypothetical protein ACKOWG_03505 [Planctomycetia bacterium]